MNGHVQVTSGWARIYFMLFYILAVVRPPGIEPRSATCSLPMRYPALTTVLHMCWSSAA